MSFTHKMKINKNIEKHLNYLTFDKANLNYLIKQHFRRNLSCRMLSKTVPPSKKISSTGTTQYKKEKNPRPLPPSTLNYI